MKGLARVCAVLAFAGAAVGFSPNADASVVVDFSGTFGQFSYGGPSYAGVLANGFFDGDVVFSSLPTANTTVTSSNAAVELRDSNHNVEFTLTNVTASYDTFKANNTEYVLLTISTHTATGPGGTAIVAPLSLSFAWALGSSSAAIVPYSASNANSYISYTVSNNNYSVPVTGGEAHIAPEPSTIGMSLVGVATVGLGTLRRRRKFAV